MIIIGINSTAWVDSIFAEGLDIVTMPAQGAIHYLDCFGAGRHGDNDAQLKLFDHQIFKHPISC